MTGNASGGVRILGSLGSADGFGIVRMEDRLDTDIDDVWSAFTEPERLARWYGEIGGELRVGAHSAHASMPLGGKARAAWKNANPHVGSWL
jgi:uncharacterized protein YndB with AHSA1/START domain